MNRESIVKVVNAVTKECKDNFEKHKCDNCTLSNKTVIEFTSQPIDSKTISDWGTDEDVDKYLWFSSNGWEVCLQKTQVGAGVQKIISEDINNLEPKDVIEMYSKMNILRQLEFIHKCYNILLCSEYKSELY